jgi:hypothetical protein
MGFQSSLRDLVRSLRAYQALKRRAIGVVSSRDVWARRCNGSKTQGLEDSSVCMALFCISPSPRRIQKAWILARREPWVRWLSLTVPAASGSACGRFHCESFCPSWCRCSSRRRFAARLLLLLPVRQHVRLRIQVHRSRLCRLPLRRCRLRWFRPRRRIRCLGVCRMRRLLREFWR